jgi:hypothetical protein
MITSLPTLRVAIGSSAVMLGQGLRSGCGAARRGLSTSAVAQQAVPALAGTQSSGKSGNCAYIA